MASTPAGYVLELLCLIIIALLGYVARTNNTQGSDSKKLIVELTKWNARQDLAIQSVEIWQDNHDKRHGDFSSRPTRDGGRRPPAGAGV